MKKRYIGTLYTVDAIVKKIMELKEQGYSEEQVSIVTESVDISSELRRQTAITVNGIGNENFLNQLVLMGITQHESREIFNEIKDGGIALFVETEDTERDSSVALTDSGEVLSNDEDMQSRDANSESIPRINTTNL